MSQSGYHNGQLIYPISVVDHKKTTENPLEEEVKEIEEKAVASEDVKNIVVLSESDYTSLTDKDANTLYFTTET